MASVDKSEAIIAFLQTCPTIKANPLFFNFGNVENNANQATTQSTDVSVQKPYIDGSQYKRYTFSVDSFKSISYNPVVEGYSDENVDDFAEVQEILDWINQQADDRIYPDFGDKCIIDDMKTVTDIPELVSVNTSLNPPTAVYRVSIQIDYIDNTKKIWN